MQTLNYCLWTVEAIKTIAPGRINTASLHPWERVTALPFCRLCHTLMLSSKGFWVFFSSPRFYCYFVFAGSSRNKHTYANFVPMSLLLFCSIQRRGRSLEGAQMNCIATICSEGWHQGMFVYTRIYSKFPIEFADSKNTDIHSTEHILLRVNQLKNWHWKNKLKLTDFQLHWPLHSLYIENH